MTTILLFRELFVGTPITYIVIGLVLFVLIGEHIAKNDEKDHQREAVMRRHYKRMREERED